MEFESLLEESVKVHGHLCAGQVLGVRMTLLGLRAVGIADPRGADRKKLMVFVEMDRCATDAIQSVSGCSLGKRSMKFLDFGKMAASFLNLETGKAVRVLALEGARDKAKERFPEMKDKYRAQIEAYREMPDDELFSLAEVSISIAPEDMPGRPLCRVECEVCAEHVQDRREVLKGGRTLCRACAGEAYCLPAGSFFSSSDVRSAPIEGNPMDLGIRSKLWLEVDGEPLFGRGRMMLLKSINSNGSINQAAKDINVSYRKALGYIKSMEKRLGIKLVERQKGGVNGGGARLTGEAMDFIRKFAELEQGVREAVDNKFKKVFCMEAQDV